MILSTAWTTPAVVLGCKTETRRDWSEKQIKLAQTQIETGAWVDLWDKSPRFKGKCYGRCKLLTLQLREPSCEIPDNAWYREGFHVLTSLGSRFGKNRQAPDVWNYWRSQPPGTNLQTVVSFHRVELNDYGNKLRDELLANDSDLNPFTLAMLREAVKGKEGWEHA